jgi:hypothetical protein
MQWAARSTLFCATLIVPRLLAAQTVHGTITNATTGHPVPSVAVSLVASGNVVVARARSDTSGQYRFESVTPGTYHLRFLVPGYQAMLSAPVQLADGQTADVSPKLKPLAAFALDTVIVRGEKVPRYLEDFYRRRRTGFGTFLTEKQIDHWWPNKISDLTPRLRGFTRVWDRNGHPIISLVRAGGMCPPLVYLDGAVMGNAATYDIDMLPPDWIGAIEAYSSTAFMPVEFNMTGSGCGVIAMWTKR